MTTTTTTTTYLDLDVVGEVAVGDDDVADKPRVIVAVGVLDEVDGEVGEAFEHTRRLRRT